ncbi:N-ethylmaleimide reductase [Methyloligella halotolerans]|uniref:N-ethylmaleimide reductase n=1 Tax=Methyloligella halotolerans TaxID=1177755 RepID=A0A1E2S0G3_9HYPH|nr:alkene reductase [Methyloligella halotolerans]ODA67986.1 N-ethylmaleimide reductase [Methyloligella halotolerans]
MSVDESIAPLFRELKMGDLTLPNRIVMAPLTRARSTNPGHSQTPLHALYYAQRAGAGLIVSEATQISQEGQGYAWTPGIFTDEQVESWKLVTEAVHNAGGRIFCQLWHVGAISHPVFQPDGGQPVSSSEWTPEGQAFVGDYIEGGPMAPHQEARALKLEEIPRLIEDYRHAARCAKRAGFDGVELHAANGYLIDQFLRTSVNKRDDAYGGSLENRLRLLVEITDALREELPSERIGVRLSPMGGPGKSFDDDPERTYVAAAEAISGKGLAYLHVVRPNGHTSKGADRDLGDALAKDMRKAFDGVFIVNGEFEPEEGARWVADGDADAIAFGRLYLANPDLPERIAAGGPYNEANGKTFYGGAAEGYVDYPSLKKTETALSA